MLSIHYDAVRVIAVNSKVGIIVSAADDGTIALYSIARKRFVRELLLNGRDSAPTKRSEIIKICISDTGYIAIHSIDEGCPYLRVQSINGILIKKEKLNEILFSLKVDSTHKILISGGQACKLTFRHIHSLEVIQEITILHKTNKLYKRKSHRKSFTKSSILGLSNKNVLTHSSAWRQQRFSFMHNNKKHGRHSSELNGIRKSILNNTKRGSSVASSPRTSKIFHGRLFSVDGNAILSQSRIIDFDLDPDNTFIVVVALNMDMKRAELLLYPLPNTRHIHQFDKFVAGSYKVLQTAKNTIWENIINVIESDSNHNKTTKLRKHIPQSPTISDLYFRENAYSNHSNASSHTKGGAFMEKGKSLIHKIQKGIHHNTHGNNSNTQPLTNGNANNQSNDNNEQQADTLVNKLNAFRSMFKKT